MRFLVYEQDPFVRTDIIETLKDAFSGVIHLIEDLRDLARCNDHQQTPSVVILSVSSKVAFDDNSDTLSFTNSAGVVIICDDLPTESENRPPAQFVPRPFNSSALISAVKTALSSQPSSPP